MSYIERFLGLATVGTAVASVSLIQRFLHALVIVLALTVASAIMGTLLLMGVFYFLYLVLLHYGVDQLTAVAITCGVIAAVTAGATYAAVLRVRDLQEMPRQLFLLPETPFITHLGAILESFARGLFARESDRRR